MIDASSIADIVGQVAVTEFENASDHYKPGLIVWARKLPTLTDERRHAAAGHSSGCRGETLYGRGHAKAMRQAGHTPSPPSPCTCGTAPERNSHDRA